MGTLPEGCRPAQHIEGSTTIGAISKVFAGQVSTFLQVNVDGDIVLRGTGDSSNEFTGQIVFPA